MLICKFKCHLTKRSATAADDALSLTLLAKMNYFTYTSHHFTPHERYELNKLTSLPMCGFKAQLVEQRTGNAEVTGSNPVEAVIFFFQASSFQLLKLDNLLRRSFFTFIYNRSSKMSYFISTSHHLFKSLLVTETIGFFSVQILVSNVTQLMPMLFRACRYLCLNQSRSSLTLVLQTGNIDNMVLGMKVKASKNCIGAGGFSAARLNSVNIDQYQ